MVLNAYNLSSVEAEAGGLSVQILAMLYSKTLFLKPKNYRTKIKK